MSLFHDFHVHALGQVRHFAGSVPGAYGLAENVEDSASRIAVLGVYQVRDDLRGTLFVYRYLDFKGDLLAAVNERLLYGEGVSSFDFTWHVADFRGHGREVHVGEHDAGAVRVPGDNFAGFVEPVSGAFAGRFAVEAAVGFHSVEFYFIFNFGALDAENTCDFAAVQVECYGRITIANRECCFERDFLNGDFDGAAGCGFRRTGRRLGTVLADAERERFAGGSDVGNFESRLGAVIPADSGVGII